MEDGWASLVKLRPTALLCRARIGYAHPVYLHALSTNLRGDVGGLADFILIASNVSMFAIEQPRTFLPQPQPSDAIAPEGGKLIVRFERSAGARSTSLNRIEVVGQAS